MPVRHQLNQDGTVTQFDADTGEELVTFFDPDGSFTRNQIEPAASAAAQPRPTGTNAERTFKRALELSPSKQTLRPDQQTVSPEETESQLTKNLKPPAMATEERTVESPAPAGIPASGLPLAGQQTSGLAAPDRALRQQRREQLGETETRAAEARTQAEQDQLDARAERVVAESDRALGRYATDLELHELAKAKVNEAEQFARKARQTPITPADALGGDKFFFAIMANVGAALSNFGSALLGQGAQQDTNVVDDIIAAGVRQQMADRQLAVEGADQALSTARADMIRAEIKANASMEKWFESRAQVERDPELRAQWAANAEERRAAIEGKQFQLAEAEYNTSVQQRAVPKPAAGSGTAAVPESQLSRETVEDQAFINRELEANYPSLKPRERQKEYNDGARDLREADKGSFGAKRALEVVEAFSRGEDVAGEGFLDSKIPKEVLSEGGQAVRQFLGNAIFDWVKQQSGAAFTDAEFQRRMDVIKGAKDLSDIQRGLSLIIDAAEAQKASVQSNKPAVYEIYETLRTRQGGRRSQTEESARNKEAQRAGPAPAPEPPSVEDKIGTDELSNAEFRSLSDADKERHRRAIQQSNAEKRAALKRDRESQNRRGRLEYFLGQGRFGL